MNAKQTATETFTAALGILASCFDDVGCPGPALHTARWNAINLGLALRDACIVADDTATATHAQENACEIHNVTNGGRTRAIRCWWLSQAAGA